MRVYVGYDRREDIAYQVCKASIKKHSPLSTVEPLVQDALRANGEYRRGKDVLASTDFSMSRYLTPYLSGWDGFSLYMDCDMLVTRDIDFLLQELNPADIWKTPVWVVQHEFSPRSDVKMDGKKQISYPRKGWASLMLFNNFHPAVRRLTRDFVNRADVAVLNEFRWCDGYAIGSLPRRWNHLVRHYEAPEAHARTITSPTEQTPAVIHWTYGGCWLEDQPEQDYDDLWWAYRVEAGIA